MDLYKKTEEMLYNYKYLNVKLKNLNLDINLNIDMGIDTESLCSLKSNIETQLNVINKALETLKPKEKKLIECIYFNKVRITDFAIENNVAQSTISNRKRIIINKLIPLILPQNL